MRVVVVLGSKEEEEKVLLTEETAGEVKRREARNKAAAIRLWYLVMSPSIQLSPQKITIKSLIFCSKGLGFLFVITQESTFLANYQ